MLDLYKSRPKDRGIYIPESPSNEFDYINHMCLSLLYRGADRIKLGGALHHELNTNYGYSAFMISQ